MSINVISFIIAYITTESNTIFNLSRYKITNMKPFICRKCFQFWSTLIIQLLAAFMLHNWIYAVIGALSAIMMFAAIYLNEKQTITK